VKSLSVVVPTRNRPHFLRDALQSLANQSVDDFEVVVSDNSDNDLSREVCADFENQLDIRFNRSVQSLSMVENWNSAINQANGQFVAVMIDKTAWSRITVEVILRTSQSFPNADVINWGHDYFIPADEDERAGYLIPYRLPRTAPYLVALLDTLIERREFRTPRSLQDGYTYALGKICFGAYRSDLIARIRKRHGTVFHPISPDYTSMTLASLESGCAVQVGAPLQISRISSTSNGARSAAFPSHALSYLKSVDPSLSALLRLPIPGLYQSVENTVAFDLTQFDSGYSPPAANIRNLRERVISEVRASAQDLQLEFVPGPLIDGLVRDLMRRRLDHQFLQQIFVRLRRELFASRILRQMVGVLPRFRISECQSVYEALEMQDVANSGWYRHLNIKS